MTRRRSPARSRARLVRAASAAAAAGLLLLAGAVPAAAGEEPGDDEVIRSYDVDLVLSADGDLAVTETITYDFGEQERHGIERRIPDRGRWDSRHDRLTPLSGLEVESPSGAPVDVELSEDDGTTARIGDPDVEVTGEQTYVLRYRLEGAAGAPGEPDRVRVDAVGTGWQVPVEAATARLSGPVEVTGGTCSTGADGGCSAQVAGGAVTASARDLEAGEGLAVEASFPPGALAATTPRLVEVFSAAHAFSATPATLGTTGAALVALLGAVLVRLRRGRARAGGPAPVEVSPPDGARPAQLGTLLDGRADRHELTATLLDLAVRGHLVIEEVEAVPGPDPEPAQDWRLRPSPGSRDRTPLRPYEDAVLDLVRAEDDGLLVSDLRASSGLGPVLAAVHRDVVDLGWFTADPAAVRHRWYLLGALALLGGAALTVVLALTTAWALVGLPLVLVGLVVLCTAHAMPVRTPSGAAELVRTRAFRDHLEQVDPGRLGSAELDALLPHAVALGLSGRWEQGLTGGGQGAPAWYRGADGAPAPAVGLYPGVFLFSTASSSSPASAGGSSSSSTTTVSVGGGGGGSW